MVRRIVLSTLALCALASSIVAFDDITPRVGVIEVYGAHKVSVKKIRSALGFAEGDILPGSRNDIEERLDKVSGVVASRIEAACCDQGRMVLYVGVEERDEPHFVFRGPPDAAASTKSTEQAADLTNIYHRFLDSVSESLHGEHPDEDLTNGYSLMADPNCREHQQTFLEYARDHLDTLDELLRTSPDEEQRALAAYLLQYAPRGPRSTKVMMDDLQYALLDADDTVRSNAMQSLKAIAVGARLHREQRIQIEPTWFVELMNSVVWSDRRDASLALVNLSENRDPQTLALLRERALNAVVEMARWRDLQHALPGFILAGRLGGLNDQQIQEAWVNGDREPVIERAINPNGKKSILGAAGAMIHH